MEHPHLGYSHLKASLSWNVFPPFLDAPISMCGFPPQSADPCQYALLALLRSTDQDVPLPWGARVDLDRTDLGESISAPEDLNQSELNQSQLGQLKLWST